MGRPRGKFCDPPGRPGAWKGWWAAFPGSRPLVPPNPEPESSEAGVLKGGTCYTGRFCFQIPSTEEVKKDATQLWCLFQALLFVSPGEGSTILFSESSLSENILPRLLSPFKGAPTNHSCHLSLSEERGAKWERGLLQGGQGSRTYVLTPPTPALLSPPEMPSLLSAFLFYSSIRPILKPTSSRKSAQVPRPSELHICDPAPSWAPGALIRYFPFPFCLTCEGSELRSGPLCPFP